MVIPGRPLEPPGGGDRHDRAEDALHSDELKDELVDLPLEVTHLDDA